MITSHCKLELLRKSHYLLTDPRRKRSRNVEVTEINQCMPKKARTHTYQFTLEQEQNLLNNSEKIIVSSRKNYAPSKIYKKEKSFSSEGVNIETIIAFIRVKGDLSQQHDRSFKKLFSYNLSSSCKFGDKIKQYSHFQNTNFQRKVSMPVWRPS